MNPLVALTSLALTAAPAAQTSVPVGPDGGSIESIRIDPDHPNHLLLGTATGSVDGVLGTTDGGLTWAETGAGLPSGVPILRVASSGDHSDKVVALAGTGVYVSLDDGATFTLSHDFGETMTGIAVHATLPIWVVTSPLEAWRTDDGGATWTSVLTTTWAAGSMQNDPMFAPSDPARAYLAFARHVWRSDDAGTTWVQLPHLFGSIYSSAVNPVDADEVWVGEYGALKRSSDGGASFAAFPTGLSWPFLQAIRVLAFDPGTSPPRLWATLNDDLHSLEPSGAWKSETFGLLQKEPLPRTLAFTGTNAWLGSWGEGIWRRGNPTQAWDQRGIQRVTLHDAAIPVPGGPRIAAGALMYARDGAADFDTILEDLPFAQPIQTIAVDPNDPTRWLLGLVQGYYVSLVEVTGSGAAWSFLPLSGAAQTVNDIAFDPIVGGRILAGSGSPIGSVILSDDDGATWEANDSFPLEGAAAVAFDPSQSGRVLALSPAGEVAASLDGGLTWSVIDVPAAPGAGVELAFDPHAAGRVFRADAVHGWSRSDDGGSTWTSLGIGANPHSGIAFHPDQPDLVYLADDAGTAWVSGLAGAQPTPAFQTPAGNGVSGIAFDPSDGTLLLATLGESAFELPAFGPYVKVGAGTPGTGGVAPSHFASGGLPQLGNATWGLAVADAQPAAAVVVGVGLTEVALPILGGVLIAGPPYALQLAGVADGAGAATFGLPLPATPSLAGASVVSQALAVDAGAPAGLAFSAGFAITLMP
jgi:photosystem II stability/assembly factor-like uncharacterized protein